MSLCWLRRLGDGAIRVFLGPFSHSALKSPGLSLVGTGATYLGGSLRGPPSEKGQTERGGDRVQAVELLWPRLNYRLYDHK